MTNPTDVTLLRTKLIDAIISAYHTTRLHDVPGAEHIMRKPTVQYAFHALSVSTTEPTADLVERAVMVSQGCGLTIDGKRVLCCDPCVQGHNDAYGKPLYDAECSCRSSARAAIAAMPTVGTYEEGYAAGELKWAEAMDKQIDIEEAVRTQLADAQVEIARMREALERIERYDVGLQALTEEYQEKGEELADIVRATYYAGQVERRRNIARQALTSQVPHG